MDMDPRGAAPNLFERPPAEAAVGSSHVIEVAFDTGSDMLFSYRVPEHLWPLKVGQRVEVPFGKGNQMHVGFCVALSAAEPAASPAKGQGQGRPIVLKTVSRIVDSEPLLDPHLQALARWISSYYVCPLGQVLAAMVPGAVKHGAGVKMERRIFLLAAAVDSAGQVKGAKQRRIIDLLGQHKAEDEASAVSLGDVLAEAECTILPVKQLAGHQIVRIIQQHKVTAASLKLGSATASDDSAIVLNEDQQKALDHLVAAIRSAGFGVTLLHGVTDSGKTEVYIRAIQEVLQRGRGAIVLLPEIALTTQTLQRFGSRFSQLAVMHSGLTGPQRNYQWQRIRSGEARVVVGARSAVFAPLRDLGLIVVDEEHDASYKQDTVPRYHARDVAIKRCQLAGAHCLLGSATPSLETLHNCRDKGHFSLIRLPKRVNQLPLPTMKLVDLRQDRDVRSGRYLISEPLAKELQAVLARKEQAILLLNRRGFSNFVLCPSCKHTLRCHNCDVTLTFHKSRSLKADRLQTVVGPHLEGGYAICHYCQAQSLVPKGCPLCGTRMVLIGLGSQRLEEEVAARFQGARVARIDSDSMAPDDYFKVLEDFAEGRIDVLAGTQMLAKGLHFPNVTLVGIISADTSLYVPDFRANERTFQLICQVAGRAGRSEKPGVVFVQTFLPDQPAIRFALTNDFDGFVEEEVKHRRACFLPPFWRLSLVTLRHPLYAKLEAAADRWRQRIDMTVASHGLSAKIRGPSPAAISRIQRYHRIQIMVQTPDSGTMQRLFASLRAQAQIRPNVQAAIDIDAVHLL
jgi:primosomal protein N' (replication factor Y)